MEDQMTLRPFREQDMSFMDRLAADPGVSGPYVWAGFRDPNARRRRWEKDGFIATESGLLAVALTDDTVAGVASWEARDRGGPVGGCFEIGLALLPKYRGRGLGTAAQAALVQHLFDYTLASRLEALTDTANLAEQTVLERIGFRNEGILRGARYRQGGWHDLVMYGLLRAEATTFSAR